MTSIPTPPYNLPAKYIIIATLLLASCNSILLFNKEASKVKVIDSEQAASCTKIKRIDIRAFAQWGRYINRDFEKVKMEGLNSALAKAAELNANSILALTEMNEEGRQIFVAYDCPPAKE